MKMKLFILLIIASIGCSTASSTAKQREELKSLKAKYETLTTEINTKGKTLDRTEFKTKQREAVVLKSKIKEVEQQINDVEIDLTYKKSFKKSTQVPAFKIKSFKQVNENLEVNLQYSGCGNPHEFELFTNGKVDKNGIVDFYIEDKTKGDNCKMLLMRTKYFNISKINKTTTVKGFRLNDSKETTFSRSK